MPKYFLIYPLILNFINLRTIQIAKTVASDYLSLLINHYKCILYYLWYMLHTVIRLFIL